MRTSIVVFALTMAASAASAQIVNVDGRLYGYQFPTDPAPVPGQVIAPFSLAQDGQLLQLTLPAGTYRITNATGRPGANADFAAFRYNSSQWGWAIVIADDATRQVVFYGDAGTGGFTPQEVASQPAVMNFSGTFSLTHTTTLDFMERDYALSDNAGGASVFIEPVTHACGAADLGRSGGAVGSDGALDNNDFIAFITLFFGGDARADVGVAGGAAGSDGALDNNDFIAFIGAFFAGC